MRLVENSFNYPIFGAEGFALLGQVVSQSQCFSFEYSQIDQAVALFAKLAAGETLDDAT
jgi:hypothetical protein